MRRVIHQKWGVELKERRIYEILDLLNLSHQKAHARLCQC